MQVNRIQSNTQYQPVVKSPAFSGGISHNLCRKLLADGAEFADILEKSAKIKDINADVFVLSDGLYNKNEKTAEFVLSAVDEIGFIPGLENVKPKILKIKGNSLKDAFNSVKSDELASVNKSLADDMIEVEKAADEKAAEYARKHCDDELQYVTGAGNLWGAAYSFAMCYMEEMLWMRTKSISAAEFFHGTLEVIDRDSNLLIFMGEDDARKQTDRVYAFAQRICANIAVFDTKDYAMEGIEEKFRGLLSPIIMGAVFNRITAHLEEERKHPLEIRRYYRRLKY